MARSVIPAADEILDLYFPVLDHGFVSLVDYMGSDEDVERAARVSFGAGTRASNATRGLIRYLRRHKHTTPSEMVELKFHCAMPIFIARQWIRHRTANVNEYSGRYSLMPMLFYTPEKEQFLPQSKSNKQGRDGAAFGEGFYVDTRKKWEDGRRVAEENYSSMTAADVAREIARIDLPLSTYTQWYWKIDLHNLMHFLALRVDSHAQWEIREYGKVMAGMMKRVAPLSYEAWVDYDVCGVRFSRIEMLAIRSLVAPLKEGSGTNGISTVGVSAIGSVGNSKLTEMGLGEREITELINKFEHVGAVQDFELDLTKAKPASFFEEKIAAAVPKTDKAP
jgi:thymidylate synthase (FAD)